MSWNTYKIFYIPEYALPHGEWKDTKLTNKSRSTEEAERKAAKMLGEGGIRGVVKAVLD